VLVPVSAHGSAKDRNCAYLEMAASLDFLHFHQAGWK
jgi:hypothetical protein